MANQIQLEIVLLQFTEEILSKLSQTCNLWKAALDLPHLHEESVSGMAAQHQRIVNMTWARSLVSLFTVEEIDFPSVVREAIAEAASDIANSFPNTEIAVAMEPLLEKFKTSS